MATTLKSIQETKAYLDSQNMHYKLDEEKNVIEIGIGGLDNIGSIKILLIFSDNDRIVGLRAYNVCKFQEAKSEPMYRVCSQMNHQFRWVKFYVDENDWTITAEDDAIVTLGSVGEELLELTMRMAGIVDEAYPNFMKAIWQ